MCVCVRARACVRVSVCASSRVRAALLFCLWVLVCVLTLPSKADHTNMRTLSYHSVRYIIVWYLILG